MYDLLSCILTEAFCVLSKKLDFGSKVAVVPLQYIFVTHIWMTAKHSVRLRAEAYCTPDRNKALHVRTNCAHPKVYMKNMFIGVIQDLIGHTVSGFLYHLALRVYYHIYFRALVLLGGEGVKGHERCPLNQFLTGLFNPLPDHILVILVHACLKAIVITRAWLCNN